MQKVSIVGKCVLKINEMLPKKIFDFIAAILIIKKR